MDEIKRIENRVRFLKAELVMKNYSGGWIINSFKSEIATLEIELCKLKENK